LLLYKSSLIQYAPNPVPGLSFITRFAYEFIHYYFGLTIILYGATRKLPLIGIHILL